LRYERVQEFPTPFFTAELHTQGKNKPNLAVSFMAPVHENQKVPSRRFDFGTIRRTLGLG
jgi:hypothetical protein